MVLVTGSTVTTPVSGFGDDVVLAAYLCGAGRTVDFPMPPALAGAGLTIPGDDFAPGSGERDSVATAGFGSRATVIGEPPAAN